MGGLALYDGDKFCGYIWDSDRHYDEDGRPYDGQTEGFWDEIKRHHKKYQDPIGDMHCQAAQSLPPQRALEEESLLFARNSSSNTQAQVAPEPEPATILEFLLAKGYITLTEDEIKDKSHADSITKSIAVIQTIWFILQVIARALGRSGHHRT
ncbi:hypothetical protein VNI00_017226 [Paramarasmius palmivorus]|uniref:Uncharacterized protein n=1 Tax=Paramarasmius palmivorus TaxID=297713 RepID=A0AAW0B8J1_9AGAR